MDNLRKTLAAAGLMAACALANAADAITLEVVDMVEKPCAAAVYAQKPTMGLEPFRTQVRDAIAEHVTSRMVAMVAFETASERILIYREHALTCIVAMTSTEAFWPER